MCRKIFKGMQKAVIFDFDGTLVSSMDSVWTQYQRTIRVLGLRKITKGQFMRHVGRPWNEIIETFWPGQDPEEFTLNYRQDREVFRKFAGMDATLKLLSSKYSLYILTSRGEKTLLPGMKKARLDTSCFKGIYFRERLNYNKPDPRALIQVCEEVGIRPDESVYVGDAVVDANCAQEAKMRFIAVLSGGAKRGDFKRMGINEILADVTDLPKLLFNT
jgi:HAD superfamily hydrolase (TIGR01549 family)